MHNYSLNDLTTAAGDGTGAENVINGDRSGRFGMWEASSPNSQPVSLTINFSRPFAVGRVVLYAAQDDMENPVEPDETTGASVNNVVDFNVELLTPAGWETVRGWFDNEQARVELVFPARLATAVRVNVTKFNGPFARVAEVEAYGR